MEGEMIYHGGNRGVRRGLLFKAPEDYQCYKALLAKYSELFGVRVLMTALIPNHDHDLFKCLPDNKTPFLRRLHWEYAWKYNLATRGHGHVFEERSWSFERWGSVVTPLVTCYIVANPEFAGLGSFENYPHTDFRAVMGWDPAPAYLERDLTLGFFSSDPQVFHRRCRQYVGYKKPVIESRRRWLRRTGRSARAVNLLPAIDLLTLTANDLDESLTSGVRGLGREEMKILALRRFDGASLRMIAAAMGLHDCTIGRKWKALQDLLTDPNAVKAAYEAVDRALLKAA